MGDMGRVIDEDSAQAQARSAAVKPSYGYDLRKGSESYAPIVGVIGGVAVAAVVFVFSLASGTPRAHHLPLSFATGLLVLGLIGCLFGSFVFASLAGESELTANLPAALMYCGAGTGIAIIGTLAAFEILASVYLPESKSLFAVITGIGAGSATVFVALSLSDSYLAGPWGHKDYTIWQRTQWLATQKDAQDASIKLAKVAGPLSSVGIVLYLAGVRIPMGSTGTQLLVGAGIVLSVAGSLAALIRTIHADHPLKQKGVKRSEALVTLASMSVYLVLLVVSLP